MTDLEHAGFATRAIHAGQQPDAETGAVIPPIHLSSTFIQDGIGGLRAGYEYARSANPTRDALQQNLASLEGGSRAFSFASGLAAEDTLLRAALRPGDHVVLSNDVYGGTYRLINGVFKSWDVAHTVVNLADLDDTRRALEASGAKIIWAETPSNPLLTILDISALAALAHEFGALLVADNTFATPALHKAGPIEMALAPRC
jgi:cystathionine gamma-synthase